MSLVDAATSVARFVPKHVTATLHIRPSIRSAALVPFRGVHRNLLGSNVRVSLCFPSFET